MTAYTFKAKAGTRFVNWTDATIWVGGVVPNSADADVDFPTVTVNSGIGTPSVYLSFVSISSTDTIAARSIQLRDYLTVTGTLSVSGELRQYADGEIDMNGGHLTAGSIVNDAYDIQGSGTIDVGTLTNNTLISGVSNLAINATTFINAGSLAGALTITVAPGQFSGLTNGVLTGTSYIASSNATMAFDVGSLITTDAASIELRGGAITARDPGTGQWVSLTTSLQTVAATGSLSVFSSSYQFQQLAVAGLVTLYQGNIGSSNFDIASGGLLQGSGSVTSAVDNDGIIRAGSFPANSTTLLINPIPNPLLTVTGAVSGSGHFEIAAGQFGTTSSLLGSIVYPAVTPALELNAPTAQNVLFTNHLGTLVLDQPATFTGAVRTAQSGDTIVLPGVALGAITGTAYSGDATGGTLTLTLGSQTTSIKFLGDHALANFKLAAGQQLLSSDTPGLVITVSINTAKNPLDFNGDAMGDVLWRNSNGTVVDWLSSGTALNDNSGFARQVSADWRIAGNGDFTGDGKTDLLWRNANGTVTFWSGTGTGFTDNPTVNRQVSLDWQIAGTGDFNGDGKTDILWRNANGTVTDWLSTGTGFADNGSLARLVGLDWQIAGTGDFDGDGKSDVLWRNLDGTVTVWTGNGTTLSDASSFAKVMGRDFHIAATGDFDGDGKTDIVWRSDGGTVTMWHSNGSTFVPDNLTAMLSLGQQIIGSGDYNGDGKDDILLRDTTGAVTTFISDGTGFNPATTRAFGLDWNAQQAVKIVEKMPFASADFNGDGKDDLLWRHANGTVTDWLSNGPGFSDNGALARLVSLDWRIVGTGDFNGDGKSDLLWRNADGTVTDWLSNGTGFSDNGALHRVVPVDWHIEATGDFNGDGKDDILWRNADGTVTDWFSNGTGFGDNGLLSRVVPVDWTIQGVGDFNGDGKTDILWRNANGTVTDWLSNGTSFTDNDAAVFRPVSADWSIVGTGDFNGDGRTDILWRHANGGVTDWLSNGSGFSDNAAFFRAVPLDWQIMGVGDFNGDGRADIEWRASDGTITDWLSNGSGFTDNAAGTRVVTLDWSIQHDGTTLLI